MVILFFLQAQKDHVVSGKVLVRNCFLGSPCRIVWQLFYPTMEYRT